MPCSIFPERHGEHRETIKTPEIFPTEAVQAVVDKPGYSASMRAKPAGVPRVAESKPIVPELDNASAGSRPRQNSRVPDFQGIRHVFDEPIMENDSW